MTPFFIGQIIIIENLSVFFQKSTQNPLARKAETCDEASSCNVDSNMHVQIIIFGVKGCGDRICTQEYIEKIIENLFKILLARKDEICEEASVGSVYSSLFKSLSLGVEWGIIKWGSKFYILNQKNKSVKIFSKNFRPEKLKLVKKHP